MENEQKNIWIERIDFILAIDNLPLSQRKFLLNVRRSVVASPLTFPSAAQGVIVNRMWRHWRRISSDCPQFSTVDPENLF